MTLNLILGGVKQVGPTGYQPFEYDVVAESVLVRLGPYDQDNIRIRFLEDTNEVVVLHNDEAVFSTLLEEV